MWRCMGHWHALQSEAVAGMRLYLCLTHSATMPSRSVSAEGEFTELILGNRCLSSTHGPFVISYSQSTPLIGTCDQVRAPI